MTPEEMKAARMELGLTVKQFGAMLDIHDDSTVRKYMFPVDRSQYRTPAPRMIRLIRAYLAGYRPDDWPV